MRPLFTLLSLTLFMLSTPAGAAPARPAPDLGAAEEAFQEGRYQETLDHLAGIPDQHPQAHRAWFLRAYALYKLNDLVQAGVLLDQLLQAHPSPDAVLLRGMIATEQRQWELASKLLTPLAQGAAPWNEMAQPLLSRVVAGQTAEREDQERHQREQQERRQREQQRRMFREEISRAEELLRLGRYAGAAAALNRAEALDPGHYLTDYFRGYLAYCQQKLEEARRHLTRALARAPGDEWSRYMLAMTISAAGEPAKARSLLETLSGQAADQEVRQAAAQALVRQASARAAPGKGAGVRLGTGFGLDTNPDSFRERPAGKVKVTPALQFAGDAVYRWLPRRPLQLEASLGLTERAYLDKQTQADHLELSAGLGLRLAGARGSAGLRYDYGFGMYHYSPLSSRHVLSAEGVLTLLPWLDLGATGKLTLQQVLHEDFAYLPSLGAVGRLGLRLRLGALELGATYGLGQDLADPAQLQTSTTTTGRGQQGSPSASVEYDLLVDYTALSHGPALWSHLKLPWKLYLDADARLIWVRFAEAASLTQKSNGRMSPISPRRDTRLILAAELRRTLGLGLELALRFDSVDNFSSVEELQAGLDYTFSQRGFGLWLRWRWGA